MRSLQSRETGAEGRGRGEMYERKAGKEVGKGMLVVQQTTFEFWYASLILQRGKGCLSTMYFVVHGNGNDFSGIDYRQREQDLALVSDPFTLIRW